MKSLRTVLVVLLALVAPLHAIYADEAYITDFQLQNIGKDYSCVLNSADNVNLLLLSEWDGNSLLSFVDKEDGIIIYREQLPHLFKDAMVKGNILYLLREDGSIDTYDAENGFKLDINVKGVEFTSSCKPNLESVRSNKNQLIDASSKLAIFNIDMPGSAYDIKFLNTDGASNFEALVHFENNTNVFYKYENDTIQLQWSRDESLSEVIDQIILDVPDQSMEPARHEIETEQEIPEIWKAYVFRITTNVNRLVSYLERFNYNPGKILTNLLGMDDDAEEQTTIEAQNMRFGYSKYLIVVTKDGILASLDMLKKGSVNWSLTTGLYNVVKMEWLEETRELIVFSSLGNYKIYSVNIALQAKETSSGSIKKNVESIERLTLESCSYAFYVKRINGDNSVEFLKGENSMICKEDIFITDHSETSVYGQKLGKNGKLTNTWSYNVSPDEKIVAFASRESKRTVTLGNVLGSRDVLYKYLYPNLAAFAVFDEQSKELFINLIDTVTGQILHTQYHQDKIDNHFPVNIIFGEYWFVYSYFSTVPIPEQKLAVVELYESLTPNKRYSNETGADVPLEGVHKPEVATNSFFFPDIISNLAFTETKFDITTKAIILILENGQVTYVPKFVLSARRVVEEDMSDDDKKEFMASPYVPGIPLNDYYVLSHYRDLFLGPSPKILSAPTNLESTSILCVTGLDIFCARVMPSGQFDVMSPGFEKGKLLATILFLLITCLALGPYGATKKLKMLWTVRD